MNHNTNIDTNMDINVDSSFKNLSLQPEDWIISHETHKSYKSLLNTSINFTNGLILLLANRLQIFDLIEYSENSQLSLDQIKLILKAKCDKKTLSEILDCLVENKYLMKSDENNIYTNTNFGKKLIIKNMNEDKNYSNILYLMERSLKKYPIAESNILQGRQFNITNHLFLNEKDLLIVLSTIEKMYSFSYDNFLKLFDLSRKMSICIIGAAKGKFAENLKLINPANDINIIDDKVVENNVIKNLKKRKMNTQIFFIPVKINSNDLIPNADLFIISYYLHWNNYEKNLKLFKKVIDSLNPEGKFVIIEFLEENESNNQIAFFNSSLSILNNFEGVSPKLNDIKEMALKVGFNNIEIIRTEGLATIITLSKKLL